MRDPLEGRSADGRIVTGAARRRIPDRYRPLLAAAVDEIASADPAASSYVYGSVATGEAESPTSDVDLLTIDLDADRAARLGSELSGRFAGMCRGVEIAAGRSDELRGDGDEAYGGRVFLHHYCVHLAGPDHDAATGAFPADRRAARGFNGDIARHRDRWRAAFLAGDDAGDLGRRVARKMLLAVAGLVSVHDRSWTTDRSLAAHRWARIDPDHEPGLATLLTWSAGAGTAERWQLGSVLDDTVDPLVERFASDVGLWS